MERTLKHEVALALERLLAKKKMKQTELAALLGVSDSQVCKWLKGDHNFTLDTIERIEKATGEYLIGIML